MRKKNKIRNSFFLINKKIMFTMNNNKNKYLSTVNLFTKLFIKFNNHA